MNEATTVSGWDTALAYYWRSDNDGQNFPDFTIRMEYINPFISLGPGEVPEVLQVLKAVQSEFPNAQVFISTFDAYTLELAKVILEIRRNEII